MWNFCLTNPGQDGIISELSDERLPKSPEDNKIHQKASKSFKKVLDKLKTMWYNSQASSEANNLKLQRNLKNFKKVLDKASEMW